MVIRQQRPKTFKGCRTCRTKLYWPCCPSDWYRAGRPARRKRASPPGSCGWRAGWSAAGAGGTAGWRWGGGGTERRTPWRKWLSSAGGHPRAALEENSKTSGQAVEMGRAAWLQWYFVTLPLSSKCPSGRQSWSCGCTGSWCGCCSCWALRSLWRTNRLCFRS